MIETVLKAITLFQAVFTLLPALVKEFETPDATGAQKKQAVTDVLKAILDAFNSMGLAVPTTIILTLADGVINALVAGYNLVGLFKKKSPTP